MTKNNPYQNLILELTENKFQCIILELPISEPLLSTSPDKEYENQLAEIKKLSQKIFKSLKENGTLWIITDDLYYDGKLKKTSFDISSVFHQSDFLIRNMIIWYNREKKKILCDLVNSYSTIIFAVKTKNYVFDLDSVREPHIWKDFEWGGGRKSRYNPKGKNPSNLWLKTRSEKGKIQSYIPLSTEMAMERCLLLSHSKNENALIYSNKKYPNLDKIFPKSIMWVKSPTSNPIITTSLIHGRRINQPNMTLKTQNKIINKSSELMNDIADETVQLVVTSPPYWGLRNYNTKNQIGYDDSYQEYLERLEIVWKECFRVLRKSGTLWVNIGKRLINDNMIIIAKDIVDSASKIGFTLKDIVIWHKPISVPTSGKNNLTDRYEHVLFFTKYKKNYYFDIDSLKNIDDYLEDYNLPKNIWRIHRRIGNIGKKIQVIKSGNIIEHTAVYPDELVRRIIELCSKPGDLVLDPFAGSGTTLSTANKLGRKWIGYELNKDYNQLIEWKLKSDTMK
ncbi:MAG: site-specific DNA-methyltransferase [Bacteroidetes bacterium]|nr:site-specific DNA-methyltransferase [Bacteroidota bacterium]